MHNKFKKEFYKGKTKTLYETNDSSILIQFFNDQLILENGQSIEVPGKGIINNTISSYIMKSLDAIGIPTHLIEKINMREQKIQTLEMLPIKVRIYNVAYGNYVDKFGINEGYVFHHPIIEFLTESNSADNEQNIDYILINENQILNFEWLTTTELEHLIRQATRINDCLNGIFVQSSMRLVSCELEFGRVFTGDKVIMMLADEITPDNCKIWDLHSNQKLDSETIKETPEFLLESYEKIKNRLLNK